MISLEKYGPIKALNQGISRLGMKPFMMVRCYSVDGILIDGGLPYYQNQVEQFCKQEKVSTVYITHHHEDHSANSGFLEKQGFKVYGSNEAQELLSLGYAQFNYQRIVWGRAKKGKITPFKANCIETSRYNFQIIKAPGHCFDQVVFFEPNQGWLFAGDAFLGEKIKWFRADEDFKLTVETMKNIAALDVGDLFCAHRPVLGRGKQALQNKLNYLLDLEQKVLHLHQKGYSIKQITTEILGKEDMLMKLITFGDVSKKNIVRSILMGPRLRNHSSAR